MTIYEALRDKLGREPTNAELKADVERILGRARKCTGHPRGLCDNRTHNETGYCDYCELLLDM